jgi:primosomal replication protein N
MQICMKATENQISVLRARIVAERADCTLTDTQIGAIVGVHASQVGRITRGEFRRISESVVQICKVLGLEMDSTAFEPNAETAAWAKLQASLRGLWDKTPEGAEKIARVLDTIGALRER